MKQKYKDNWPFFEKLLGYLRYLKIRKYILLRKQYALILDADFLADF